MEAKSKPEKPVVTWRKYLGYLGTKAVLVSAGSIIFLFGCFGLLIGLLILNAPVGGKAVDAIMLFLAGGFLFTISAYLISFCTRIVEKYKEMTPVKPIIPQSISRLPDKEALVRASQEPMEGQEKVLLRAATTIEETNSAELLRSGS